MGDVTTGALARLVCRTEMVMLRRGLASLARAAPCALATPLSTSSSPLPTLTDALREWEGRDRQLEPRLREGQGSEGTQAEVEYS